MLKSYNYKFYKSTLFWKKGLRFNYIFFPMPWFFFKIINLFMKNGNKAAVEFKFLNFLKSFDYLIFLEIFYNLEIPYFFYSKKKRSGRHSYVYYNTLVFLKNLHFCQKSVKTFFVLLNYLKTRSGKKNLLDYSTLSNFIYFYYKDKGRLLLKSLSYLKDCILKMRSVRHFRW